MNQRPAQQYIQADVLPPDPASVDWRQKRWQFKLYTEGTHILLPYHGLDDLDGPAFTLGQIGELLADLYGLLQQYYHLTKSRETQLPEFSLALRRVVPSGGALFPGEIYLFVREGHDLPAGIYHYDVAHHALDLLRQGDEIETVCAQLACPGTTPPMCLIALSCFFWKDGFKYGAFSYRLQGFDLGTIIAQCLALLHHHALPTTVHYQFLDAGVNGLLGLDLLQESVYALISIGQWRSQSSRSEERRRPDGLPDTPTAVNALGAPKLPSVARWPLVEAVHRAACIEMREQFRDQRGLAPLMAPISRVEYALPSITQDIALLERYRQRHSALSFLPKPISMYHLGLFCHLGLTGYQNDIDGGSMLLQHTLLYCVINRVEGIPPGIYSYDPRKHACELVVARDVRQELQAVQKMEIPNVSDSSVCFFAVGDYTTGFQYYGDRWYRIQNMEAGILAQRLYLVAAALRLGCRASLGFHIPATHKLLCLSENEDVLIQMIVGPEIPQSVYYEQPLR